MDFGIFINSDTSIWRPLLIDRLESLTIRRRNVVLDLLLNRINAPNILDNFALMHLVVCFTATIFFVSRNTEYGLIWSTQRHVFSFFILY